MPTVLLQVSGLTAALEDVRRQFETGGSFVAVGLVLAVTLGLVILVWRLAEWQGRRRRPARLNDPMRLYNDLIAKLGLPPGQSRILQAMASDVELEHPAVLLLSSAVFEDHAERWRRRQTRAGTANETAALDEVLSQLRRALFLPA